MAGLFKVPERAGKSADLSVAKKSNTANKASSVTVKSGGSLIDKINTIRSVVEKNLGYLKDDYIIIQDTDTLHRYIDTILCNGIFAVDTETTGLDPLQNDIVGMSLYTPNEPAAYIPINHKSYITNEKVDNQLSVEEIKAELERVTSVDIIMFNACFDMRFIRNKIGVDLTATWDCYLAARLLNENEGSGNNGLKKLHNKYVLDGQGDAFKFDDLFKGVTFDFVPINVGYIYAAHDAIITYELYEFQKQYLKLDSDREDMRNIAWVFHNIEMPCVKVVAELENTGVSFDIEYAQKLHEKYHKLLEEKTQAVYNCLAPYENEIARYRANTPNCKLSEPINIDSPTQIAILLYDVMGIESVDDKSPRGTGEDILLRIDTDFTKAILDYRGIGKLINTYIDKLPECVNPKDGRVHCKYNQYGADTGRFSSSEPNLQNIPSHNKDIRKMFKATDGYVLMSSDYSQQEPRLMAQLCGDDKMLNAYREGKDLYAEIAALSFNTTYENCLEFRPDGTVSAEGKSRRSQAKSILLGVLYGRGVPSIAEQLGTTTEQAQRIKDSVFKGFPAIEKFEKDSLDMAETLGYVTTLWGRKRRLPILQEPDFEFKYKDGVAPDNDLLDFDGDLETEVPENLQRKYMTKLRRARFGEKRKIFEQANEEGIWVVDNTKLKQDATRQVVNARIQGSAADMSKLAMIKVGTDERLKELGFRLLIPVHDELIGECPKENAKECAERFAMLMNTAADRLTIPVNCDVEITEQWYGERIEI